MLVKSVTRFMIRCEEIPIESGTWLIKYKQDIVEGKVMLRAKV
jgi:hypothetical protein